MSMYSVFRTTLIFHLILILFLSPITQGGQSVFIQDINDTYDSEYWAVIVGISDYQGRQNDLPVSSIHLKALYTTLLTSDNWQEDHILLLINEQATYANVLYALDWLANQSDDTDIVLFSFQGHGSSIDDIDGDEDDGQDEGIVAWEGLSGIIVDDILDIKFDKISCKGMFLIFHSCLSGGLIDHANRAAHFSPDFQQDVADDNRVILVSSWDQGLALAFPSLTRQLAWGLQEMADDDNQNTVGYGVITAEEAAKHTKAQINKIFLGLLMLFPPAIISIIISELMAKIMHGYWIIPIPMIYDAYPGELPIYII